VGSVIEVSEENTRCGEAQLGTLILVDSLRAAKRDVTGRKYFRIAA
jgi:hypothetical protein